MTTSVQFYSPYFQTLYNEAAPVGAFGRGTHYSVLGHLTWFNATGTRSDHALWHQFAVIWDEDHDERVIAVLEALCVAGRLAPVVFIGERKGTLTILVDAAFLSTKSEDEVFRYFEEIVRKAEDRTGDHWPLEIGIADRRLEPPVYASDTLISDSAYRVQTYLAHIDGLWTLGLTPR